MTIYHHVLYGSLSTRHKKNVVLIIEMPGSLTKCLVFPTKAISSCPFGWDLKQWVFRIAGILDLWILVVGESRNPPSPILMKSENPGF